MKKIIFATGNQDKMREIREILADMDVEVVSMKEAGIHADIVEDGSTFEENAVIKAKTIVIVGKAEGNLIIGVVFVNGEIGCRYCTVIHNCLFDCLII